jgi:hypothetical protein
LYIRVIREKGLKKISFFSPDFTFSLIAEASGPVLGEGENPQPANSEFHQPLVFLFLDIKRWRWIPDSR